MTKNTIKRIYVLRLQCEPCELDKMISFYRVPNATAREMYVGHEDHARQHWPKTYGCNHEITFTREIEKKYGWDTKAGKVVERW